MSIEVNKTSLIVIITFLFGTLACQGQDKSSIAKAYNLQDGVAVQGYDVVSYHSPNGPVKGKSEISHTQENGVTYWFANEQNKTLFLKAPQKYEPQYGGYCAYAIAKKDRVKIDPKTFKILDDKLYLFYNFKGYNTLLDWNKNETKLLSKANENWKKMN